MASWKLAYTFALALTTLAYLYFSRPKDGSSVWYQAGSGVNVGRLVGVGISVAVAVEVGVAVFERVGAAVGMGVAAGPQAESRKTNKPNKCADVNDFSTTKATIFQKEIFKTLCGSLSFLHFVSLVLKVLLFTWPIQ